MSETASNCVLCTPAGEQLLASTSQWRVILADEPDYPGFCRVIWQHHVREMSDLAEAEQYLLMQVVWRVESALREILQPEKINLASLGNVVPHLHWHLIPRFADDRHFPQPVWASPSRAAEPVSLAARRSRLPALKRAILARLQDLME